MITDFLTPIVILVLLCVRERKFPAEIAGHACAEAELDVARKALRDYRDALSDLGK